ncbi:MAG: bifunctional riboflavin kinase/FAD synthetase [Alphaproteobacteria bacterium]|nr:bifunctional riboflavin kinase/FAD synthetase [Alphaproteobacteria bacterium]
MIADQPATAVGGDGGQHLCRVFRDWQSVRGAPAACYAIGNFDGVHHGHRAVIAAAQALGQRLSAATGVLTFEPHPRQVFRPEDPPFRLTPPRLKVVALSAAGVDQVVLQRFTPAFATMDPQHFIDTVLIDGLAPRAVVVGRDFCFGKGRSGSAEVLTRRLEARGIPTVIVAPVAGDDGVRYSSTAIRSALQAGTLDEAAAQLGRAFRVSGHVRRGDQRGRTIGFPTANLSLGVQLRPRFGVYAVRVAIRGQWHAGVANLGMRPTVGGTDARLEVHVFDWSDNLYGQRIDVDLVTFLRVEHRFASLEELMQQIRRDAETARTVLANRS